MSRLAILSLICGGFWALGLGSVLAVLLGHLARRRIDRHGLRGRWAATTGLVLGYLGLALVALLLLQGGVWIEEDVPR